MYNFLNLISTTKLAGALLLLLSMNITNTPEARSYAPDFMLSEERIYGYYQIIGCNVYLSVDRQNYVTSIEIAQTSSNPQCRVGTFFPPHVFNINMFQRLY